MSLQVVPLTQDPTTQAPAAMLGSPAVNGEATTSGALVQATVEEAETAGEVKGVAESATLPAALPYPTRHTGSLSEANMVSSTSSQAPDDSSIASEDCGHDLTPVMVSSRHT